MKLKSRLTAGALATVVAGAPGVALAAGGNSVHIKAPHKAHLNKQFHYTVKGKSSSSKNTLATFINTGVKCKSSYKSELAFNSFNVVREPLSKGKFKHTFTVTPASTGAHYICAYVYKTASSKTLAKAQSKYNTKP